MSCFVCVCVLYINRRRVRQRVQLEQPTRVQPVLPTRVQPPRKCRTHKYPLGSAVEGFRLLDLEHAGPRFRGVITQYDKYRPRNSYLVEWDNHAEGLMDWWPRGQLVLWTPANLSRRRVR